MEIKIVFVDCRSNDATLQTLRFGEQVRSIRNEPVINVVKETDADLSNNIRHLKVYSWTCYW